MSSPTQRTTEFLYAAITAVVALFAFSIVSWVLTQWKISNRAWANGALPAKKAWSRGFFPSLHGLLALKRSLTEHRFLDFIYQSFEQSGSWTVVANVLGSSSIWTADPENVKAILGTQQKSWNIGNSRKKFFGPVFSNSIFVSDGSFWHESRAMMRPIFARQQLADIDLFRRHFEVLASRLPKDGQDPVNLLPLFLEFAMDASTELLFGISTHTLSGTNKDGKQFAEAFDYCLQYGAHNQHLGKLTLLFRNNRYEEGQVIIKEFVKNHILTAMESYSSDSKDGRYIFLHEMLQAWSSEPRIRGESLGLLLAGRETTATLLSSLFYQLARRPDVWEKLRRECIEAPDQPTFEDLRDMKYLNSVIREGNRLFTIVPDISRTAAEDCVLPRGGGSDGSAPLFVSKGTDLKLWTYVMHRRRDIYGPDAEAFRPERWEDLKVTWQYAPFGGGARICLGQQFAITETSYVLFRMARMFKAVEPGDSKGWLENLGIVVTNKHGTNVKLISP